jgi:Flp pilus assembly protein TadD/TolB-like protein
VAATVVLISGLLLVPEVSDFVLERLRLLPLPAEKRLAVLPIHNPGGTAEDRAICEGLQDYVVARLGELDRFHGALWVVPAAEVRRSGITSDGAAGRSLGATLALDITVQRVAERTVMSATLFDTARQYVVRAATRDVASGAVLLDQTVDAVVAMLDIELGADARKALRAGATSVPEASALYAQGLAHQPYEQARTALEKYEQRQSLEQAISLFNAALARDPRYALAHAGIGEAYLRLWSLTREQEYVSLAEQHCRRAVEMDPLVGQVWLTLGSLHAQTGKAEEALADFQRALARDPGSGEVVRERAAALERLRRFDEAERDYQAAIKLRPNAWAAHSYYGVFLARRGRNKEAETILRQALALAPDNARIWSGLGVALYGQERFDEAEAAWTRSIAIAPTATAISNLATRLYYTGRYADAARAYERAVGLSPLDYRVWRNLAGAYEQSPGDRSRAVETYRKAIELIERERTLTPQNAELLGMLASCLAPAGDRARAEAVILEATRLDPANPNVASDAAGVYEQLGNRTMALRWLDQALRSGHPRTQIERSPEFAALRADRRYAQLGQTKAVK